MFFVQQYITQSAARLMRALFTIALKRGWASVAAKCLCLCKSIDRRQWGIESPLRQFSKAIPADVIRRVERKEFPWERFFDLKSHEVRISCNDVLFNNIVLLFKIIFFTIK